MRLREYRSIACLGLLLATFAVACQPPAPAPLENTPENRAAQIERYFVATPPEKLLEDTVQEMAARLPQEQRARFAELMTKHLDQEKLRSIMRDGMAKHFTADELRALADFYGSELGKAAMGKFGAYMAEVMPAIQAEIIAAVGKIQSEIGPQPPAPMEPTEPAEPPKTPAPPQG